MLVVLVERVMVCVLREDIEDIFRWSAEAGFVADDDDGAFEEDGVLGDGVEEGVGVVGWVGEVELFVDGFFGADELLRGEVEGFGDCFEFIEGGRCFEVFDDGGFDVVVFEELEGLAAFGTAWVVIDGDFGHWGIVLLKWWIGYALIYVYVAQESNRWKVCCDRAV